MIHEGPRRRSHVPQGKLHEDQLKLGGWTSQGARVKTTQMTPGSQGREVGSVAHPYTA